MPNLVADCRVHGRKPSETMKLTCGRIWSSRSKWGCISLVALAKEAKRDMDGSSSVLSTPLGMPPSAVEEGKGRSMMDAVVSERE